MASSTTFVPLYYPKTGNLKKAELKAAIGEQLEEFDTLGIDTLIVADSKYFEYLTGTKGLEKQIGKKFECVLSGYEHITVLPALNYKLLEMTPEKRKLQTKAFETVGHVVNGTYEEAQAFKFDMFKVLGHPKELNELHKHKTLAIDIETTGLRFERDELVSISFSWDESSAYVIPIHRELQDANNELRERKWKVALKEFFTLYNGVKVLHNGLFDAKFLIRHLFMEDLLDNQGRVEGVDCMTKNESLDDTMIMAYLCLNSTSRTSLSLKDLSYEFLGDYGVDVKEVLKLNKDVLLDYNGRDTVGTFWVYNKYRKLLVEEAQEEIYNGVFKASFKYLLNMMLSGLPLSKSRTEEVTKEVQDTYNKAIKDLQSNDYVKLAVKQLRVEAADKYNSKTKVKKKTYSDFSDMQFNPNSSNQLRVLLFDVMGYDVKEETKKGAPSTSRSVIEEYLEEDPLAERIDVLEALIAISKTSIILTTFLQTFRDLWTDVGQGDLGRLYGNQRLGGTISGRLSSNSPNFANMPSGGKMGKLIKSCFQAPEGYLFVASDYAALESLSA